MKKANIILSAIGLLSVVGGALAFKAQHRFSGEFLCYTTVGTPAGLSRTYKAILTTRYDANNLGKTLFCTQPIGNVTYKAIKVEAATL
ncbi:hypothetical protein [Chitinophaga silvisoli]|uniref:Uncharacterized protein n=1 Tax=Chitinophaga silvisoli TaxID=2291814 RepID=A0A3E1NMR0_9BACT|nr:hypothetical protein [Chitinophaga silvisoli]RFM29216.1 hypothetical protein DXN04_33880 [Chitinophaga silvisoli]